MWYRVQWSYASSLTRPLGGAWGEGRMVDLTDAEAAAVLADSPGVLVAVTGYVLPDPGDDTGAEVSEAEPIKAQDRMIKKPGRPRKAVS